MIAIKDIESLATGQTLSLDERALLGPAMEQLAAKENLSTVGFWGRILGQERDYLIVAGTTSAADITGASGILNKKLFYCTSDQIKLEPLPASSGHPEVSPRTRFTGDVVTELAKQLAVGVGETDEAKENVDGMEDEEEEVRPYTELHYLAHVVGQIDWHTAVCPKGAYALNPSRDVVPSISFAGLGYTESANLESYQHLREPSKIATAFDKGGLIKPSDFLDAIPTSHPRGAWSLTTDSAQKQVTIRSLVFPGYAFFHRINTNSFGGVYVGDGIKNADIAFML